MPLSKFKIPKVDLPPSPLPLPRSLFIITCASLLGALLTFTMSMLDLGYLSFWFNPCASIITIIYHVGVVLISRRPRVPRAPSYFSTAIFCAYMLALIWLIAFILTVAMFALHNLSAYRPLALSGLPANVSTQRLQVFLTLYETVAVAAIALTGHAIVRKEGPDPQGWRNLEDGDSQVDVSMERSVKEFTANALHVHVDVEQFQHAR